MLPITIICLYAQLIPRLETSNEAWGPCCQFTSVILGSNLGEDIDAGRCDLLLSARSCHSGLKGEAPLLSGFFENILFITELLMTAS